MPGRTLSEFLQNVITAIRYKDSYNIVSFCLQEISPARALGVKDVLEAQQDLEGKYKFSYDENKREISIDLEPDKPAPPDDDKNTIYVDHWPWEPKD
ncbi:hypothetical protein TWF730_010279 [Orbilia blumenaviensis]|uniref:Uncharacterized protein n=1 Tax=Orbilia blumenaviensis TaxID=1796055 RepID=A0AAV9UR94_9PEZI